MQFAAWAANQIPPEEYYKAAAACALAASNTCHVPHVPTDFLQKMMWCLYVQASRPKMKRWIDSFGEVYSKAIIAATLVILGVLPMLGVPMLGSPTQRGAFYRAMGFLTTASPCALVLVPLAYVSAIGAVTSRSPSISCQCIGCMQHCDAALCMCRRFAIAGFLLHFQQQTNRTAYWIGDLILQTSL